ncbi:MAG: TonB-dependent receptor, partial [Gemmatimonadaceae bacterium]|nr:TonB-dependent receptor [Chitinophagaceae bacterium]
MKRLLPLLLIFLFFASFSALPQGQAPGIITGNLLDEKSKAVAAATIELVNLADSNSAVKTTTTDKDGNFQFTQLVFAVYRLKISSIGFQPLKIDSIQVRMERFDFNLNDILLHPAAAAELNEVIVYAEKPLIQSRDGNITFNAAESALSAGSSASDLLKNVPLVTTDPNGKVLVRGKEPKILIDDKPVELNVQQLQDLLESLPGSSIEKIEVLTNPPPQYANEQGGVINIVTRKGKVGMGGRINLTAGTRGEYGISGNFNYRKNKLALNLTLGSGYNIFNGEGYSKRENVYADSTNYFNTTSQYRNTSTRPNARFNLDYELNKQNAFNILLQYNQNNFNNRSGNTFLNMNRFMIMTRSSRRAVRTEGQSINPNLNFTW